MKMPPGRVGVPEGKEEREIRHASIQLFAA
jgi:hypothetical protein